MTRSTRELTWGFVSTVLLFCAGVDAGERILRVVLSQPNGLEPNRFTLDVTFDDETMNAGGGIDSFRATATGFFLDEQAYPVRSVMAMGYADSFGVTWSWGVPQITGSAMSIQIDTLIGPFILDLQGSGPPSGVPDTLDPGSWTVGFFVSPVGTSNPNPISIEELSITQPRGGCCFGTICFDTTPHNCAGAEGVYVGTNVSCFEGACDFGAFCSVFSADDCATLGGVYAGDGTTCAGSLLCGEGCVAEFTGDIPPSVDVLDLLEYLVLWFEGCP